LLIEKIRTKRGVYSPFGSKFELNKFKKLPSREVMKQYAYMFLEPLGRGSSREVYTLSSRYALKIARNDKGVAQNEAEVDTFTNPQTKNVVAKVQSFDPDYNWMISDLVKPFDSEQEFQGAAGLSFDKFCNQIADVLGGEPDAKDACELAQATAVTIKQNKLMRGDVNKIDSWGLTSAGDPVLLDYGFTKSVADKHYPKKKTPKTDAGTADHESEPDSPSKVDDPQRTGAEVPVAKHAKR